MFQQHVMSMKIKQSNKKNHLIHFHINIFQTFMPNTGVANTKKKSYAKWKNNIIAFPKVNRLIKLI